MEDSEIQDAMEALREEATAWKKKFKSMELKKRESDLALNKIKTEINSLRSVDKLWKESAKTVYVNLSDVKHQFDCQVQQVLDGLAGLSKAGQRVSEKLPYMRRIKATIAAMQKRIALQDETIVSLNNKLRVLGAELVEKNKKIERLSEGIDEEVERLVKPMRDRLADSMLQVMKEKAARAQERRELADLWPADQLLPTILMRYRALSDDERIRRCKIATERNASMALSLEIRSNVAESKMWETKYDDYGRTFYQHMSTGETSWEVPDIMNYKPPPGRDEMGNIVITEENDMNNFFFRSDNHGEVYYENRNTGEVSFIPPCAYKKIPVGKPRKVLVAEAAALVLSYIKEKISLHIQKMNKIKHVLENPLTIEERTKKEKALRNRPSQEEDELVESNDDNNIDDLSAFQYDIETVEFLADTLNESQIKGNADKDPVPFRSDRRLFLQDAAVRSFDVDNYGPTILETDLNGITTSKLRKIVEDLAICEEKLERKLQRSRNNLKDFSFKLMEMLVEEKKARTEKMELEREAKIQHDKEMRRKLMEERKTVAEAEKMRKFQELEHTVNLGEAGKILAPDIDIVGCDGDVGLDTAIDTFSLNELPTDNPKNIDKNDGLQQKSLSSAKLSDGLKSAELNDVDSILQVNIDERESQESAEDTDEESNISNADLESILSANTAKFSTSGEHLFGLTNVEYLQFGESHPESLIVLCKKLSNFALFCGYNNLRMENFTDDSNKCYSFVADAVEYETTGYGSRSVANGSLQSRSTGRSRDNNSNVNTETLGDSTRNTSEGPHQESDDEWLTCSFFLMLNKDMLDKIADKNSNLSAHVVSTFGFDFQVLHFIFIEITVNTNSLILCFVFRVNHILTFRQR